MGTLENRLIAMFYSKKARISLFFYIKVGRKACITRTYDQKICEDRQFKLLKMSIGHIRAAFKYGLIKTLKP